MSEILTTKEDLLDKLRAYANNPDDDNIKYKNIIRNALLNCPELLYALNNNELESELFDEDGNLLIDKDTGELLGEVDRYFGDNSNIRPSLFIPDTQTTVNSYVCYQVAFDELPRYQNVQKYTEITFNIFGMQTHLIASKESTTDNNYLVRTLIFQITDVNSITYTQLAEKASYINKIGR